MAGAMRSSMRSVEAGLGPGPRASAVYSSLTSQHSRRPPGARPRAMQIDEYPVNVPTSTARRAPTSGSSNVSRAPWSAPICIPATRPSSAGALLQRGSTSSGGAVRSAM